jgi:hypothetical protein
VLHRQCLRCSQAFPEVFFSQSVTPLAENLLHRLGRPPARRWHRPVDRTHRSHLHHETRWGPVLPALAIPTGEVVLPKVMPPTTGNRALMMPARRQTRAAERAARIASERRVNEIAIAAEAARKRIAARNDPPPF